MNTNPCPWHSIFTTDCAMCSIASKSQRTETISTLSKRFSDFLITTIGIEDTRNAANANRTSTDPDLCASHDYCDANQVMLDAANDVGISNDDVFNDLDLINKAWSLAKANDFYTNE